MKRIRAAGIKKIVRPNSVLPSDFRPTAEDVEELTGRLSSWGVAPEVLRNRGRREAFQSDLSWAFVWLGLHSRLHGSSAQNNAVDALSVLERRLGRVRQQLVDDDDLIGAGLGRHLDPSHGTMGDIVHQLERLELAAATHRRWLTDNEIDQGPLLAASGETAIDAFLARLVDVFEDTFGLEAASSTGVGPSNGFVAFATCVTEQAARRVPDNMGRSMSAGAVEAAFRRLAPKESRNKL